MTAEPAKPKRKRRWWVRALRVTMLLAILLVLALSGALWWVYSKRVALLNNALTELGPMRGEVGRFEVTPMGGVELHDLVFTDRATGAVVARVPHVSGQANLSKLPPDEIRSLTVKGADITLTAAMIEAWRKQAAASSAAEGQTAPAIPFGIRFAKVDLEDAHVRYEPEDGTSVDATLSFHGEDLKAQPGGLSAGELNITDAHVRYERADGARADVTLNYRGEGVSVRDGSLSTGDQELRIEDGTVNGGDVQAPFAIQKLSIKGRVNEGFVELTAVDLDKPRLHATPGLFAMFGMDFSATAPAETAGTQAPSADPQAPPSGLVRGIRIKNAIVRDAAVSTRGFTAKNASGLILPDAEGGASYEVQDMEWSAGAPPAAALQALTLQHVKIETPDDGGHLRLASASMDINQSGEKTEWKVGTLHLDGPDVRWTPQLRRLLTGKAADATTPAAADDAAAPAATFPTPPPPPNAAAGLRLLLGDATVTNATLVITDAGLMPFELHTKGSLRLANLLVDGSGLHSQSYQTVEVTEGRLVFPTAEGQAEKKPWLELPHGEMVVMPDEWNERTRIARLTLDKLVVRMRDGNTPWGSSRFAVQGSGLEQPTSPTQPPTENREPRTENREPDAAEQPPWWKRINCGQLTVTEGQADLVLDMPRPVDLQAQVDITTQRMEDGGSQHTVRIAGLTTKLPTLSPTPFPVAEAAMIEGVVRLPEMWTQRHLDELHLSGASVEMSDALLKLFEPDKPAADPSAPAPNPDEPALPGPPPKPAAELQHPASSIQHPASPWRVGLLSVEGSTVTVTNLVPGLPAVKFGVSFEVKDTPLLAEDIADDVAPQRVELSNLKIPSPNGTARYVAELDSIFVRFSLGGLMRKEIEGIEIVSPTLFVGEDLFWYVDFYRKYAERGGRPAPEGPQVAANDAELERKLAAQVAEAEPATSDASWSVRRLQVHSGKLVLAPKGVRLKGFHAPFPFHIDSAVTRGTLNADMEIPSATYELPDLNLQFVGMSGKVQFNLPLRQKDNNLVETFEVDSIRWKEIRTGKAFLSVTYDSAGIYSQFGAEAYEGYINGEFNVYLDDSFHWDGWVTGKNVQTHDLTRILCPGYFIMDGHVEASLVAQGSKEELYQADGTFQNHTPGKFTIKALNGLIDDLPKDWDPLKAQIAKIGLETLRDFEYEHAALKCRFYGREGNGRLTFKGPTGSRNFDINVYDHRWRTDDEAAKMRVTTTVTTDGIDP